MWLNQSQPVSIDTLSCEKGASASEGFNGGHLDNSPRGVWEGCKYKWQLPPPSRASSAKQASLLLFPSLQRKKNPAQSEGQRITGKKALSSFLSGARWRAQLFVFLDLGLYKYRSHSVSQSFSSQENLSVEWNIFYSQLVIIKYCFIWQSRGIPLHPCD